MPKDEWPPGADIVDVAVAVNIVEATQWPVLRTLEWVKRLYGPGTPLTPRQQEAVRSALTHKVTVLTGGPGTGKTTILRCILQILEKKHRRMLLCSPTGRAAKRMTESTGEEALTLQSNAEAILASRRTTEVESPEGQSAGAQPSSDHV